MLTGTLVINSLVKDYWTPTDHNNTPYLRPLKIYGGFKGLFHEFLSSWNFCDYHDHQLIVHTNHKNNFDYINLNFFKKDLTQTFGPHWVISPNISIMVKYLSNQFLPKCFVHTSQQRIQYMAKPCIYTKISSTIAKLQHTCYAWSITKGIHIYRKPTLLTDKLFSCSLYSTLTSASSKISPVGNYPQILPFPKLPSVPSLFYQ